MSRTYDELLADYHELQRSFLDICQKYAADVEAARQQGRDEGLEEAAKVAYVACAETRHVTLGDKCEAAILALRKSQGER